MSSRNASLFGIARVGLALAEDVGDTQLPAELLAVLAFAQQAQGQHVGPGMLQQVAREAGCAAGLDAFLHQLLRASTRDVESFTSLGCLDVTPLGDRCLVRQLVELLLQVRGHAFENRRITIEITVDAAVHAVDAFDQRRIAIVISDVRTPARRGLGHLVQPVPGGMLPIGEKGLVIHGHPKQWRLQFAEQVVAAGRTDITRQAIEQHRHQFHDVELLRAEMGRTAIATGLAQLRQHVPAQVLHAARLQLAVGREHG